MITRFLLCCISSFFICSSYADEVVWKGKVNSDGTPTELINLNIHDQYQIKVSQSINLGKWIQANEKLANDACYEFSTKLPPSKFESLKNSLNISVCDGEYHNNHIYLSEPFVAEQIEFFSGYMTRIMKIIAGLLTQKSFERANNRIVKPIK
jgi:hypothetical protein